MNLRKIIDSQFSELSPELQRAAEFSRQNAHQLVVQSMRTFAGAAGVKPATLMRLAQRLGFSGWGQFKDAFIDEIGLRKDSWASSAEECRVEGTPSPLYAQLFQAQQANLAYTQNENHQAMAQAIRLLDAAENVYICGFRASFPIAWSLYYGFRRFHRQVTLIDGLVNHLDTFTREFTAQDCILLTSFAPYACESLEVLQAGQQAGANLIAMTDSPLSPLAQAADCTLLFTIDSPSFSPSIASGVSLAECLLAMLAARQAQGTLLKG